ncbi:MAG: hypothetical protein JNG88_17580 [Phycisphaerales bacterium]|nr:hypothetical protein [Phycisphaerales bacterium]
MEPFSIADDKPLEVLLRHRFGRDYFGLQTLLGFVSLCAWAALWPGRNGLPLLCLTGLYLLLTMFHRIAAVFRSERGHATHSRYTGTPYLRRIVSCFSEITIKQYVEPIVGLLTGILLLPWDEPVGSYLMFSSFCLMCSVAEDVKAEKRRAQDMYDAYVEQQAVLERFRAMRDEIRQIRSTIVSSKPLGKNSNSNGRPR